MNLMNKFFILFVICSIFFVFTPSVFASITNVQLDKSSYVEGDRVFVTGQVQYDSALGDLASMLVINPAGTEFVYIANPEVDTGGNFSDDFQTGGVWNSEGTYTVRIQYGSDTLEIPLEYNLYDDSSDSVTPTENSGGSSNDSGPSIRTLNVDKSSYVSGDVVSVFGTLDYDNIISFLTIRIIHPDGTMVDVSGPSTNSDGTFAATFQTSDSWNVDGTYIVKAFYGSSILQESFTYSVISSSSEIEIEPEPLGLASFVNPEIDPQHYVNRYNNEIIYKEWFDANFPQYTSIYQAVGLSEPTTTPIETIDDEDIPVPPNSELEPDSTLENSSPEDSLSSDPIVSESIEADDVEVVAPVPSEPPQCGEGTELIDGVCEAIKSENLDDSVAVNDGNDNGCLIATATYGSELAPQVQQLREIRDNSLLQTQSGTTFMTGFNQFYYTFSPTIADWERQNPAFKEAVKITITPLISSLAILNYVNIDSEAEMLGYGIGVIAMNIGMYFVAPAVVLYRVFRK